MNNVLVAGQSQVTTNGREFLVERIFNAPRALVWEVWTQAQHLAHWWGPTGWTVPVCTVDFRPGGVWHYCMKSPTGEEAWGKGVYQEIVAPDYFIYKDAFSDAEGNINPELPVMTIKVVFSEENGRTKVTSTTIFASEADLQATIQMGMEEGFNQTLARLDDYLATL